MDFISVSQLLGNLGEFVGAVAVVVTLALLVLQVRQSNVLGRRGEQNAAQSQISGFRLALASNRELAELVDRGLDSYDVLDSADRRRFDAWLGEIAWCFWHTWDRSRLGFADRGQWTRGEGTYLASLFTSRGGRAWWEASKGQFYSEYRDAIDEAIGRNLSRADSR